jgi:ribonuclease H / adenosylcobalamin/alpha-ribazole phosphatase
MLILARHGRTAANAQGLLQGRMDLALDEVGRVQAKKLAVALASVDVVISSPLRRAMETAEALGKDIEIDDRWQELDFGCLDGQRRQDIDVAVWKRLQQDVNYAPDGGESLAEMMQRVTPALDELLARSEAQDIVVFTHVMPIKASFSHVLHVGMETGRRTYLDQASITRLDASPFGPVLHSFNETGHLRVP